MIFRICPSDDVVVIKNRMKKNYERETKVFKQELVRYPLELLCHMFNNKWFNKSVVLNYE